MPQLRISDRRLAEIDRFVERAREHWHVPGVALAVVRSTGSIHVRAYGQREHSSGELADTGTSFAIASCSKAFTATLAVILESEGKICLDDPIQKYVPGFQLYDPWVSVRFTIRDGLSNRSGLSNASLSEYGSDLSRKEVLERAKDVQPKYQFRDRFTYSNIGFIAVAEAISRATGDSFSNLMADRIFGPLEMHSSSAADEVLETLPNVASPHLLLDEGLRATRNLETENILGAGSHAMSAQDAAHWLRFQLTAGRHKNCQLIPPQVLEQTHALQTPRRNRNEFDGYGLGWEVRRQPSDFLNHHEGVIDGFRATSWFDRQNDSAVFVAANCAKFPSNVAISHYLREMLLGREPKDWIRHLDNVRADRSAQRNFQIEQDRADDPLSASTWSLAAFQGVYHHRGFGILRISQLADCLWFRIEKRSRSDGPLVRYAGLCFEHQPAESFGGPLASPRPLSGSLPWIRFHPSEGRIEYLDWHDWFGTARFTRLETREA